MQITTNTVGTYLPVCTLDYSSQKIREFKRLCTTRIGRNYMYLWQRDSLESRFVMPTSAVWRVRPSRFTIHHSRGLKGCGRTRLPRGTAMDERRIWLLVTSQQLLAHLAEAGPSRPLWQHKIHVGHSGGGQPVANMWKLEKSTCKSISYLYHTGSRESRYTIPMLDNKSRSNWN